jgi:hypothetical protein
MLKTYIGKGIIFTFAKFKTGVFIVSLLSLTCCTGFGFEVNIVDIVADLSKEGLTPYIINNNYTNINIGNYRHSWIYSPIPECKNLHLSNNFVPYAKADYIPRVSNLEIKIIFGFIIFAIIGIFINFCTWVTDLLKDLKLYIKNYKSTNEPGRFPTHKSIRNSVNDNNEEVNLTPDLNTPFTNTNGDGDDDRNNNNNNLRFFLTDRIITTPVTTAVLVELLKIM